MAYRWVFSKPPREESVPHLRERLNVPREIAHLLALRNVDTYEKAKIFFRPENEELHDPFLMKDMEEGACRLSTAIRNREKVVIYGDYDVDGTTAVSILYTFLKGFGLDVEYYIPHRFKEGYGINPDGIQFSIDKKANLIVSVDCGITAIDEALYVKENGIDLIICDHHTVGDSIPEAVAVLDPNGLTAPILLTDCRAPGLGLNLYRAPSESWVSKAPLPINISTWSPFQSHQTSCLLWMKTGS